MTDHNQQGNPPRDALRAYLQRCEVRLSTMHRIAGAFISGAGLLFLLPVLLKDALASITGILLAHGTNPDLLRLSFHVIPVFLAFFVPVIALYLLLKDLILFYFSASIPEPEGQADRPAFHPRFALTAIPFANDEGDDTKKALRELQFKPPLSYFLLPHHEDEKEWLSKLVDSPEGQRVALPESRWLNQAPDNRDRGRLRMAFGLAGAYDRPLIEEVAKTELSLIRHNLLLRRLVMRYIKALILFIWTALVMFILVSGIGAIPNETKLPAIAVTFLVWSSLAPLWVRAPVRWIYREFDQNSPDRTRDHHLLAFERFVIGSCILATASGVIAIGMDDLKPAWALPLSLFSFGLNFIALLRSYGGLNRPLFQWI